MRMKDYDTLDIKASVIEEEIAKMQKAVDSLQEGSGELTRMAELVKGNLSGEYSEVKVEQINDFKVNYYDHALGEIMVVLKYLKNYREMLRIGSKGIMLQTQDYIRVVPKRMIELESEAEQLISISKGRILADNGVYMRANSRKLELEGIIATKNLLKKDTSEEERLLNILNTNLSIYGSFDDSISDSLTLTTELPLELEVAHKVFRESFENSKVIYEGIDYEKYKHDQFMANYFDFYLDVEHQLLQIGSYYPGFFGSGCDAVNGILYFIEGISGEDTWDDFIFSWLGAVPGFKETIKGGATKGMSGFVEGFEKDIKKGLEEGFNLKKIFKNTSADEAIGDFIYSMELNGAEIFHNRENIKLETPLNIGATGAVGIMSIIVAGVL